MMESCSLHRFRSALFSSVLALALPGALRAVDVQGKHENPRAEFGGVASYRLTGDTTFGWKTGVVEADIDLGGHALVMETGGGNRTVFSGAITGAGSLEWHGGGVPQVAPSILGGERPNAFRGRFTLVRGVLDLNKPAGADAIPGDLLIGAKGSAVVRLVKPNQINDAAHVVLGGSGISGLDLQGNDEKFASLSVETHAVISMGDRPAALIVGASGDRRWDLAKTLTVRGFRPGRDKLSFGSDARGLSGEQLARIGFASPAGLPESLYTAKIGSDGQLSPGVPVAAVNPPFDVSREANLRRAKLYEVPGLARLTGKSSPLKDGTTVVFFGDSITWQNGYIEAIGKALRSGEGTRGRRIKLVNRGINGGGVLQVRDGANSAGFPGNSPQAPFAELIAGDKADLAVVFIGINDVWWRKTSPEDFEKGLRDLVAAARANKTRLVLATLTVHNELPDGKNADDPKIEQYAEITRQVAASTKTTLVDLRRAYVAYLQNHNAELRVDGTLYFAPSGILTYDGVHPTGRGVALLADLIADGMVRAMEVQP